MTEVKRLPLTEDEVQQLVLLEHEVNSKLYDEDDASNEAKQIVLSMIDQCNERNMNIDVLHENLAQKMITVPEDVAHELRLAINIQFSATLQLINGIKNLEND